MYVGSAAIFVFVVRCFVSGSQHTSGLKILTPEEARNLIETKTDRRESQTASAKEVSRYIPQDTGGNYGDLICRYRENGDVLLLRELVIIDELSPSEQDVQWYASLNARRISSVRVLNIGRERAYCYRIEVAGADALAYVRVPPRHDPRVLIEIYGF
ncbi:hypothetical protein BDFB_006499 [Asbolus verrucosus]|uniref:Uncharacterized protein n=1 Tax=Asbolus verrucosus TaxID=1661398 RepID=A0A482VF62_ASBVE|nr:hypothetical protein BDFB_006499 [Asbolus verrucosus]